MGWGVEIFSLPLFRARDVFRPGPISSPDARATKTATMLLPSLTSALILAGLSVAQTPPGHKPEVAARLDLIVGSKVLTVPGTALTKAGA